jgi:hypothetical protein
MIRRPHHSRVQHTLLRPDHIVDPFIYRLEMPIRNDHRDLNDHVGVLQPCHLAIDLAVGVSQSAKISRRPRADFASTPRETTVGEGRGCRAPQRPTHTSGPSSYVSGDLVMVRGDDDNADGQRETKADRCGKSCMYSISESPGERPPLPAETGCNQHHRRLSCRSVAAAAVLYARDRSQNLTSSPLRAWTKEPMHSADQAVVSPPPIVFRSSPPTPRPRPYPAHP